ncbi:hypothetical protein [Paracoccus sp. AS002]|uniref:hypothetical protein n=1 Tax=Paracoccus sp. AS002 TaxID=3019545 RepID=UPI0023E8188D|nr:hypothetical protein [Paracoccus sp. AS002]MDF3905531.1 hypothetical protein [Paracoccus sp. AS002]
MILLMLMSMLAAVVSIAGIVYPFKPYGKRKNAFFSLITCFVVFLYAGSNLGKSNSNQSTSEILQQITSQDTAPAKPEENIASDKSIIIDSISGKNWEFALNRLNQIGISGLDLNEFKRELEAQAIEIVKSIPANESEQNKSGYRFLAALNPESGTYREKLDFYTKKAETDIIEAEKRINAEQQAIVGKLRKKEDKIEGVTFFEHPNQPKYLNTRSTVYLYIGRRGENGRPWLRMKVIYTSSDWLFVQRVQAWHDGIKEPFVSGRFDRDHNTKIWEWQDTEPTDLQLVILESMANAKEAVFRFEGQQYRKDVTLGAGDKKAIREVLEAYRVMLKQ